MPADHALVGLDTEAEAFRAEVCRWLTDMMSPQRVAGHLNPADRTGFDADFERQLHRAAGERGWLQHMPPTFTAALQYETTYHDAPLVDTAVVLAAAPIGAFGSDDHRELLGRMRRGEVTMCIAYTEPDAGNDLSGLTTAAEPQPGGGYRLNGTKSLITAADKADICLTIARTEPGAPIRRGASMFAVDMHTPGVSVHPQRSIAGYDLWKVRFEDVHLPARALVGERGRGWKQMVYAVEQERSGMFSLGWCQRLWDELQAYAIGTGATADPVTAMRLARLWGRLQVGRRNALRLLEEEKAGMRSASAASAAKVTLTELLQQLAEYAVELAGPGHARFAHEYLFRFDGTVSVGASELHRAGIAASLGVHPPRDADLVELPDFSTGLSGPDSELAGHAAALLTLTVQRVRIRSAYGSTLAALGPVQQRIADLWLDTVAARDAVREAASNPSGLRTAEALLSAADSVRRVVSGAHQLCGGWGYLEEAGLGVHTRAITDLLGELGCTDELAGRLAAQLFG